MEYPGGVYKLNGSCYILHPRAMIAMILALVVTTTLPVISALPEMKYRFTSFATTVPHQAAKFCERYFGGEIVENKALWLTHRGLSAEANAVAVATTTSVPIFTMFILSMILLNPVDP